MMNKYLELELIPSSHGGGHFSCSACFKLDNLKTSFKDIEVKIDTGCSLSTIPVKKLQVSDSICKLLKINDIDAAVAYVLSYGVETGGESHPSPITRQDKIDCKAMKFLHSITGFTLNNVQIPTQQIYLNYNRSGNILIGMDILQTMISHWDISRKTGKLTLLSCPRETADDEFYNAMKEHFGLIRDEGLK